MNALPQTQTADTDFADAHELGQLELQLEELMTHHHAMLAQESALDDLSKLQRWIDDCQSGSEKAERKLYSRGADLLKNIKDKLSLAMEEQHRIIEESPTAAATAKGRDAERYSRAKVQADTALHTLEQIAGRHDTTPDQLPK